MLFNGIPSFGLEKQKSELLVRELSASKKERLLLIPQATEKLVLLRVTNLDMKISFLAKKSGKHSDSKYYSPGSPRGLCCNVSLSLQPFLTT